MVNFARVGRGDSWKKMSKDRKLDGGPSYGKASSTWLRREFITKQGFSPDMIEWG
jgi:hypothetical protein